MKMLLMVFSIIPMKYSVGIIKKIIDRLVFLSVKIEYIITDVCITDGI